MWIVVKEQHHLNDFTLLPLNIKFIDISYENENSMNISTARLHQVPLHFLQDGQ